MMPLYLSHPAWTKTSLGIVVCQQCGWRGPFFKLLCEPDSRILWCPTCTSSRWKYEEGTP